MSKTALITGGGRGIGKGIALVLASKGYDIVITGRSDRQRVADSIKEIESLGVKVYYHSFDLADVSLHDAFISDVLADTGCIDLLVNNAGVAPKERMDILNTTQESYDFVMDINLRGTFFLTQKIANTMIDCKRNAADYIPRIVNISSISAYTSSTARGEYCISKSGLSMVTMLFADRLAEYNIPVFEIRPGIIKTDMTSAVTEKYDRLIEDGLTPTKRWGYPVDIGNAVSACVDGSFDFATGQVFNLDGGFHLRRL